LGRGHHRIDLRLQPLGDGFPIFLGHGSAPPRLPY
jgi:hypothetical protein